MKLRERKRTRFENYDYSKNGYYFITICAGNREEWFGKVEKEEMILNNNTVGKGLKPFPTHGLSEMIRGFKTFSSRKINEEIKNDNKFQWQKSFYDHVIRNEKSLHNLRHYIILNSLKWEWDIEMEE